jgi:aspartate ammonia-lyase
MIERAAVLSQEQERIEHDLLGDRGVPRSAYYGIHTVRAIENFPITGVAIHAYPDLIVGLAAVKQAAAEANREIGLLEPEVAAAIVLACEEIRGGALHDQFVVDVVQGGAGTSTNMNANEVIANRVLEHLGHRKGDYARVHPLEHVNMSQSTNDVYPTAIKMGVRSALARLDASLTTVQVAFAGKEAEFADILKMGRTQLQDAVPMTLGQEFGTYAVMVDEDMQRLREAAMLLAEVNLGGTAIGTGLNADPRYSGLACKALADITGMLVVPSHNLVEATQDVGSFVQLSGVLKRTALKLSKICNDLRLLSSGPTAGLGEINLPPVQAGSSIMPGKVNPVIPEVVSQVAFEVAGHDVTIAFAAEGGQLQLNPFEPVIAHCLFASITHLTAACNILAEKCISGITANASRLRQLVEGSVGLVTALNPHIGYEASTRVAQEALATGRSVIDVVLAHELLTEEEVRALLQPDRLIRPLQRDQPTDVRDI